MSKDERIPLVKNYSENVLLGIWGFMIHKDNIFNENIKLLYNIKLSSLFLR